MCCIIAIDCDGAEKAQSSWAPPLLLSPLAPLCAPPPRPSHATPPAHPCLIDAAGCASLAMPAGTGGGRVTECKLVLVRPLRRDAGASSLALGQAVVSRVRAFASAQLGDTNVGKSSLVLRFVKNQFVHDQCTTVGAAFLQQAVPLDDSEDKIQFGIWDTAGSERYKALAPMVRRRRGLHIRSHATSPSGVWRPPARHTAARSSWWCAPRRLTRGARLAAAVLPWSRGRHRRVRHHLVRAPQRTRRRLAWTCARARRRSRLHSARRGDGLGPSDVLVGAARAQESFEGAKKWVAELKQQGQPNVVVALAANKCDHADYRVVLEREGQ
eukprot:240047-Prymnesium_polylepis.1